MCSAVGQVRHLSLVQYMSMNTDHIVDVVRNLTCNRKSLVLVTITEIKLCSEKLKLIISTRALNILGIILSV